MTTPSKKRSGRVATDEWLERNGCFEPFPPEVYADIKAIFEAPLPPISDPGTTDDEA